MIIKTSTTASFLILCSLAAPNRLKASEAYQPTTDLLAYTGNSRVNGVEMPIQVLSEKSNLQQLAKTIRSEVGNRFSVIELTNINQNIILVAPILEKNASMADREKASKNLYTISDIKLGEQSLRIGSQSGLLLGSQAPHTLPPHPLLKNLGKQVEVAATAEYQFERSYNQQQELLSQLSAQELALLVDRNLKNANYKTAANQNDNGTNQMAKVYMQKNDTIYVSIRSLENGLSKISFQEIITK